MAAAVAAAALDQLFPLGLACLLGKAGQGVELRQDTDDGLSVAEGAGEGGLDAADIFFHLEAALLQGVQIQLGGGEFLQGKLGQFPDLIADGGENRGVLFDVIYYALLCGGHRDAPFMVRVSGE